MTTLFHLQKTMARPALVTVSMFLNQTSRADIAPLVLNHTRSRPYTTTIFLFQRLLTLLKVARILLPLYPLILLIMLYRPLQRRILYAHKSHRLFPSSGVSRAALDQPELQGFLPNQATPHWIPTPDGQSLHSWLIMPIGIYTKHESTLTKSWSVEEAKEIALQHLRDDPKAVLVLYLHGNGNHLATQWRCDTYRSLSAGSPDHIYVLAFDYRGFGKSSGSPTEEGLIIDALSVLSWIEKKLKMPRKKVLLAGHSLGASIAVAAVQRVFEQNRYAEFAGVILCSGFTNLSEIVVNMKIGGAIPILKPLTWSKRSRRWISAGFLADSWRTEDSLKALMKMSDVIRLSFIHAVDDDIIPCFMSDILYHNCKDETTQIESATERSVRLGSTGSLQEVKTGGRLVRQVTLSSGGHNMYLNWHVVSHEVARIFMMTGAIE